MSVSRLTYKLDVPLETKYLHYDYMKIADYDISKGNFGRITDAEVYNKLGQLEDLEETFGIDFPTLYMALKDGIYTKQYGHLFVEHFVLKCDKELHCRPTYCAELRFALKDYKKTWALCREDLEDD